MNNRTNLAISVIAALSLLMPSAAHACGIERWAIKTLADPQAKAINSHFRPSSISALDALYGPADPDTIVDRFGPAELTTYIVHASLVGYRIETDGDYHLVLADPTSRAHTMIGEIPRPSCAPPALNSILRAARHTVGLIGHHQASRRWWWLDWHHRTPPIVTIVGVGFFDRAHGQNGAAPNGLELHPVLFIRT
ncbi:MAG: hypothetical protein ACYDA1_04375 [Vulcanimicrobiaceae bacterium]